MREPGIYHGIPIEEYHGDPTSVSKSGLDDICRSPLFYYGTHLDPERPRERKETAAQLTGNLCHCAILEPDQFNKRYRVGPSVANKNLKVWQDFKKECEAAGETAIDSEQYDMAMQMRHQALTLPDAAQALASGRPEVSAYWRDPETGVLCRCRPDWTHDANAESDILLDVKSYDDASEAEFARQVARMNYFGQDAYYRDGYALASGRRVAAFLFVAVETKWPHVANLMMLDDDGVAAGRRWYRRALNTYAECLKADTWPGYAPGVKLISLPQWVLNAEA